MLRIFKILGFLIAGLLLASCMGPRGTGSYTGGMMLPSSMLSPSNVLSEGAPEKIALLLPMTGGLSGSANAIRNGFFSAYYYAKSANVNAPEVTVVNTANQTVDSAYRQALAQGATLIVGPLTKTHVAQIKRVGDNDIPVLALNTVSGSSPGWLYQFGLPPENDAVQVAERMRQAGFDRAIVIAPANALGNRIVQAFSNRYQQLGGSIVDQLNYTSSTNFTSAIRQLLQYQPSKDDNDPPQRREDFDAIFLVAFPQQASQIRPMLKFYYAGDVPVYATSQVYNGFPNPTFNRDLDGIKFADMPWVIDGNSQPNAMLDSLHQRISSIWEQSFRRYPRLYALGIDAYLLANRIYSGGNGNYGIQGASGLLYIDGNNQVVRVLSWAEFQNGLAVTIP